MTVPKAMSGAKTALALAALVLSSFSSHAAIIERTVDGAFVVSGQITLTTGEELLAETTRAWLAEDLERIELHLDSEGGNMVGALHTAHIINSWERSGITVETRVTGTHLCASACPVIFFAADNRYLSPDAELLFHALRQLNDAVPANFIEDLTVAYLGVLADSVPEFAAFLAEEQVLEPQTGDTLFTGARLMEAFQNIALPIEPQVVAR